MLKVREDGQLWFTRVDEAKKLRGSILARYLRCRGYSSLPEGTIMTVEEKGMFQLSRALDLSFVDDFCYLDPLAGSYVGVPPKDESIPCERRGRFIPFKMCGLPMRIDLDEYSLLKTV